MVKLPGRFGFLCFCNFIIKVFHQLSKQKDDLSNSFGVTCFGIAPSPSRPPGPRTATDSTNSSCPSTKAAFSDTAWPPEEVKSVLGGFRGSAWSKRLRALQGMHCELIRTYVSCAPSRPLAPKWPQVDFDHCPLHTSHVAAESPSAAGPNRSRQYMTRQQFLSTSTEESFASVASALNF